MDKKREKLIEQFLGKIVKNKGGLSLKLWPFNFTGLPDRLILLPGAKLYFVELKREIGGKLSPRQKIVHKQLNDLGFPVYILNSYELITDFLKDK